MTNGNVGFNNATLLVFALGLVLPLCVIAYFIVSPRKKEIAIESIAFGFGGFLASAVAVAVAVLFANMVFLAGLKFEDETSGLTIAGAIISFMIAVLGVVCESLKILTIRRFHKSDKRTLYSGAGYAAGVVIAQSVAVFIAMNIMQGYDVDASWSIVSGGIVLVTGVMYLILSVACDAILSESKKSSPAFGISFIYYVFWISEIFASRSPAILYTVAAAFFIIVAVLCAVFISRKRKGSGAKK